MRPRVRGLLDDHGGATTLVPLTSRRYLHRNGYRHAWPDVRPWRASGVPR
jgi:hypothetical protein